MKRIKEEFLNKLEEVIKLEGKAILEIGCGSGARSVQIAKRCASLVAIEPDGGLIATAEKINTAENIRYQVGRAEGLDFEDKRFDMAIFTLSLHHVPAEKMAIAINEAIRVTKQRGYIVFLEPTEEGSFFEAEIRFDACDGDERLQKSLAYKAIKNNQNYTEIAETLDETIFQFNSVEDFTASLNPKKSLTEVKGFLEENNYILTASRRISIYKSKEMS
jgi:ubiquinone/menaquinone biosynthesis C-methylase UbiE